MRWPRGRAAGEVGLLLGRGGGREAALEDTEEGGRRGRHGSMRCAREGAKGRGRRGRGMWCVRGWGRWAGLFVQGGEGEVREEGSRALAGECGTGAGEPGLGRRRCVHTDHRGPRGVRRDDLGPQPVDNFRSGGPDQGESPACCAGAQTLADLPPDAGNPRARVPKPASGPHRRAKRSAMPGGPRKVGQAPRRGAEAAHHARRRATLGSRRAGQPAKPGGVSASGQATQRVKRHAGRLTGQRADARQPDRPGGGPASAPRQAAGPGSALGTRQGGRRASGVGLEEVSGGRARRRAGLGPRGRR